MKKFAVAFALALAPAAVMAADLPSTKAPVPYAPLPVFTWTGFYVGVNAGVGGDEFKYTGVEPGASATAKLNSSGLLGGAQIGYNHQMGSFVLGLEADYAFANIDGKIDVSGAALGLAASGHAGGKIESLGTVRARAGYAMDRTLFYVTGGWAYGSVETSLAGNLNLLGGGVGMSWSKSKMQNGWALGAGVEYALTNNITMKAEYLYVDLGKDSVYQYALQGGGVARVDLETKAHVARIGVNYKF